MTDESSRESNDGWKGSGRIRWVGPWTGLVMILLAVSIGGYTIAFTGGGSSSSNGSAPAPLMRPEDRAEVTASPAESREDRSSDDGAVSGTAGAPRVVSPRLLMEWYGSLDQTVKAAAARFRGSTCQASVKAVSPPVGGWPAEDGLMVVSFEAESCIVEARVPAEFASSLEPGQKVVIEGGLLALHLGRIILERPMPRSEAEVRDNALTADYLCGWYAGLRQGFEIAKQGFVGWRVRTTAKLKQRGPTVNGISSMRMEDGTVTVTVRMEAAQAMKLYADERYVIEGNLSGIAAGRIELSDCEVLAQVE